MAFQIKIFTITTEIIIAGTFGPDGNSIIILYYLGKLNQRTRSSIILQTKSLSSHRTAVILEDP
jgi:hypothetical protein